MSWRSDFGRDVAAYRRASGGGALKLVLSEQGLWALLEYRLAVAVYRSTWPKIIKWPVHVVLTLWHKVIEMATGISLPCTVTAGPGLYLPHGGLRIVNAGVALGADCVISQGVTIGVSGRGERRGVPRVGDRVYFGVNAVVVGKIVVGDDVLIGANSLVNRDVPAHCTVVGVPAVVVNQKGSEGYIAT